MSSSPRQGGGMSSPPRGRSRGGTTTQRIVSNPIGRGSLSASGSETFAHYHVEEGQTQGGSGGLLGESSTSSEALATRLSCNNTSFEELPDERSNLSVGGPEAEESMQSVVSKVSE